MSPRVTLGLAIATPVASLLAFAAQFVSAIGGTECSSSTSGATTCTSVPAVTAWDGPLPYTIAVALILLSFAPLVSLRTRTWWPAAVSAGLQVVPQVISFGGFIDWAPALVLTVLAAVALARRPAESFN